MSKSTTENRPRRRHGPMGGPGPMLHEKPKDFKNAMRRVWEYLAPHRAAVAVVLVFSALSTALAIIGPRLLGDVTTEIVDGMLTGRGVDFNYIGGLIATLAVLYVFSSGFAYAQSFIMSGVSNAVGRDMRGKISAKLHLLPLKYFDNHTRGEILSRITNDVDSVQATLQQSLAQIVSAVATVAGAVVMMLLISPLMTLAAILVLPVSLGFISAIIKRSQKFFKQQQEYIGELNGQIEEMYGGHSVVQAFNGQKDAVLKFAGVNQRLRAATNNSQFISGLMMPLMNLIGNLGYVTVCIFGGWLAVRGTVGIGGIQAFIQYMRQLNHPMGMLAQITNLLQSTAAAAERVFELLDEAEDEPEISEIKPYETAGNVSFENVVFGYRPERIIIKGFSADIKAGRKVAIVGPTGAGKTTIVKLLMRFYDLNSGKILIDGADIKDMPKPELRSAFGMVLQDAWLYNATILENIRYGSFGATDAQVKAAAKAAHCDEFIRSLPGGYNMVLSEDADNISQGQRQLFSIARVVLRDPRILILDEATSSVDTRTELLIQDAMDKLIKNRTSFVIAHRLSTVKNADLILVLDNGDVVEQGTHKELLAKDGFYTRLYNSQFS